ncbi:MAG: zinc metalloprotease HtpX [Lactobacillus sp.]|nr:zinc metalloprotease HtpX [Lactobacillus sp.]
MLYNQISKNKRKTWLLFVVFFLLLTLIGVGIGYFMGISPAGGAILGWVISLIYILIVYSNSTNIVMGLNGATEIHEQDNPQLWHIVEDMAMVGQVPMPRVFIIDDPSPNAFATGRNPQNSAVAVTSGLLEMMNREELEGVLGHEISHIRNYDIRVSTIAIALVSAIAVLVEIGTRFWWFRDSDDDDDNKSAALIGLVCYLFAIIFGQLVANLVQLAISRNREYLADASSVELTRNPQGLISALEKISGSKPMKHANKTCASLYIEDPLTREEKTSLFSTHPSTASRIKRLEEM